MKPTMGWYVDPNNDRRDLFWTGQMWSGANRPAEEGTPEFPDDLEWKSAARPPSPSDTWSSRAVAMYVVAALVGIGSIIGGIVLAVRTGQSCSANPYDDTIVDCSSTHPFVAAGIAIIVAGLIQAMVVFIVGRLCGAQAERVTTVN